MVARDRMKYFQVLQLFQNTLADEVGNIQSIVCNGFPGLIDAFNDSTRLHSLAVAAKMNKKLMLETLLALGANVNAVDIDGMTALMHAANYGNFEILEYLISMGADLNKRDLIGRTAIYFCLTDTQSHRDCFLCLIGSNIDINNQTNDGRLVLHYACRQAKNLEFFCTSILDNNSAIDRPNEIGRTPLMLACASGNGKIEGMLLKLGADVMAADVNKRTPAHEAAENGNLNALFALHAMGANFNEVDALGNTPLHLAADGQTKCCRFLCQRGANAKIKNVNGETPAKLAAKRRKRDCVKILIKAEKSVLQVVPPNLRFYDWTILYQEELTKRFTELAIVSAAERAEEHIRQSEEIQDGETNIVKVKNNSVDDHKLVPLNGLIDILQDLYLPINLTDVLKILYAHLTAVVGKNLVNWVDLLRGKKYNSKQFLLAAFLCKKIKQNPLKMNKPAARKPPLDICVQSERDMQRPSIGGPPIAYIPKYDHRTDHNRFDANNPPKHEFEDDSKWYLENPGTQFIGFNDAARNGDLASIRKAVQQGYHVDIRDKYYKTPLMAAAHVGDLETVKALLELGADVNARDNFFWTPLHHAAHSGMIDVVELLVENGAQLEAKAMNGSTPIYRAIESSRIAVVNYLIECGTSLSTENKIGYTPLTTAYYFGDPQVISLIELKMSPSKDDPKIAKKPKARDVNTVSAYAELTRKLLKENLPRLRQGNRPRVNDRLTIKHRDLADIDPGRSIARVRLQNVWSDGRKTWEDRIQARKEERERWGWDASLPDCETQAFSRNLARKMEGFDGIC